MVTYAKLTDDDPVWEITGPTVGAVAAVVDFNAQKTVMTAASPLNTTSAVSTPITDGTNFGMQSWTVNPDGSRTAAFWVDETLAATAGQAPVAWTVPGSSTVSAVSYEITDLGELRVGDVVDGAADGRQWQVVRFTPGATEAADVRESYLLDVNGAALAQNSGRPTFGATTSDAVYALHSEVRDATQATYTRIEQYDSSHTLTATIYRDNSGAIVTPAGPFILASEELYPQRSDWIDDTLNNGAVIERYVETVNAFGTTERWDDSSLTNPYLIVGTVTAVSDLPVAAASEGDGATLVLGVPYVPAATNGHPYIDSIQICAAPGSSVDVVFASGSTLTISGGCRAFNSKPFTPYTGINTITLTAGTGDVTFTNVVLSTA